MGKAPILKPTPRRIFGNRMHGKEVLTLKQVLLTNEDAMAVDIFHQGDHAFAFYESRLREQAYPESGLENNAAPNLPSIPHSSRTVLSRESVSQRTLDSKILQAIFGPRRKSITTNLWALDKFSWESCMGPYLVLFKQRLENQWPLAARIPLPTKGIAPNHDGPVKVCNLLVAICRTTIDSTPLHERRNFGALTFGNCLRQRYRQGLLQQVAADIPLQAEMIVKTLNLIDIVSRSSTFWTSNLVSSMSSESLMNTRISSISCEGRKTAETHIEPPQ